MKKLLEMKKLWWLAVGLASKTNEERRQFLKVNPVVERVNGKSLQELKTMYGQK